MTADNRRKAERPRDAWCLPKCPRPPAGRSDLARSRAISVAKRWARSGKRFAPIGPEHRRRCVVELSRSSCFYYRRQVRARIQVLRPHLDSVIAAGRGTENMPANNIPQAKTRPNRRFMMALLSQYRCLRSFTVCVLNNFG